MRCYEAEALFSILEEEKHIYMKILRGNPSYNSEYFTKEAIQLVSGLLQINVDKRLGSSTCGKSSGDSVDEIMSLPFFDCIDWDKLNRKEIPPPFVPDLNGPDDTKYNGKVYDRMDPYRESEVDDIIKEKARQKIVENEQENLEHFPRFTYTGSLNTEDKF